MAKKIAVITGSPRKGGNSDLMAEAFVKAAEEKGHSVQCFAAGKLKIGGCHACNTCFKTGKPCSFDDDFNPIAEAMLEADAVVFAMPTYWFSIPSNIKGVFDRMYSFMVGGKMEQLAGKKTALMICCMSEDISVMDDVKSPFEKAFGMLKWDCIGEVLIPGVGNPGDVQKTDGLKQSAALAELI